MVKRDNGMQASLSSDVPTWRPTVQSYQNLSLFTSALAVSAGLVLALTYSFVLVFSIAGLVLAAAATLSLLITRRRVQKTLAEAEHPELGNWPGSAEDRRDLRRAGRRRCARSIAMAVVVGAFGGFYPIIGGAFVGIGIGGALDSTVIMVLVQRYEAAHNVTVLSLSKFGTATRRRLVFGLADGAF